MDEREIPIEIIGTIEDVEDENDKNKRYSIPPGLFIAEWDGT